MSYIVSFDYLASKARPFPGGPYDARSVADEVADYASAAGSESVGRPEVTALLVDEERREYRVTIIIDDGETAPDWTIETRQAAAERCGAIVASIFLAGAAYGSPDRISVEHTEGAEPK